MKRLTNSILLAIAFVASISLLQPCHVADAAVATAQDCGCGASGCTKGCRAKRSCGRQGRCRKCPKCETDVCSLERKEIKAKKSCFKVEQKIICIPNVRLPWQKCCPDRASKTRTINVLKKHSYECPSCSYKWSLEEPEVPEPVAAPVDCGCPPAAPIHSLQPEMQYEPQVAPQTMQYQSVPTELPFEEPQAPIAQPSFEPAPTPPPVPPSENFN